MKTWWLWVAAVWFLLFPAHLKAQGLYFANVTTEVRVTSSAGTRSVLPTEGHVLLNPDDLLLVPTQAPGTVRISAKHFRYGFAYGDESGGIVWQGEARGLADVYVPRALSPQALAVRVLEPSDVVLGQLARERDRLRVLRFRQDALHWLHGRKPRPPEAIDAPSARFLSLIREMGTAFGMRSSPSFVAWAEQTLDRIYLGNAALGPPWFPVHEEHEGEVRVGRPLQIEAQPSELVSVRVLPKLSGPVQIELRTQGTLIERLSWTGWERTDALGYAATPRVRRVAARGPVEVRAVQGLALVSLKRQARTKTLDEVFFDLWDGESELGKRRLDPLLPYVTGKFERERPFKGLSTTHLPMASLASLTFANTAEEVSAWSRPALAARSMGTGQLRLAALDVLLRSGAEPDPALCRSVDSPARSELHAAVDLAIGDLCGDAADDVALSVRAFDALSSRAPDDGVLLRTARALSSRLERSLVRRPEREPVPDIDLAVPDDGRSDGYCRVSGRSRLLAPGTHDVQVEDGQQNVATFRSATERSTKVRVGAFDVSVQGAGLASRVRLPVGHTQIVVSDQSVLLELSDQGALPCRELRDVREFWPLSEPRELSIEPLRAPVSALTVQARGFDVIQKPLSVVVGSATLSIEPFGRPREVRVKWIAPADAKSVRIDPRGQALRMRLSSLLARSTKKVRPHLTQLPEVSELLTRVREASRALSMHTSEGPLLSALRARASALTLLGQLRLAENDYLRLAEWGVFPEEPRLQLPGPLNLAAQLPPLVDADLVHLVEAVRADALGDVEAAAIAFSRIDHVLAQTRAAQLRGEQSWAESDPELALSAYAWAVRARGPEPSILLPSLSRLESAVRFASPQALDSSAGTYLEVGAAESEEDTLRSATARAWLDAPADVWLMREDESLVVRINAKAPVALVADTACRGLRGEPCEMHIDRDGSEVSGGVVVLAVGEHVLTFTPSVRSLGFVRLCPPDGPCTLSEEGLFVERVRRWFAASPRDSGRLTVVGPTVVRLFVRAAGAPTAFSVQVGETVISSHTDKAQDGEVRLEIPVFGKRDTLEIRPSDDTIHVRLSVAEPRAAAARPPARPSQIETKVARGAPLFELETKAGRDAINAGPFSLWGHSRYVPAQVADLDTIARGSPYLEVALRALVLVGPVYAQLGVLQRSREGPESLGAFARIDTGRQFGFAPRLILNAKVVGQDLPPWSWGLRTRASAWWALGIPEGPTLYPWIGVHYRTSPPYGAQIDRVDPDVYSDFSLDHPVAGWAGLSAYYRPLLDVSFSGGVSAMTNPDFGSLDRLGPSVRTDIVTGRGLSPWVSLEYSASYRFADGHRPEALLRQQIDMGAQSWLWVSGQHRFALGGTLGWIVDAEQWVGMIQGSWLWSPRRGVTDLTPDEVEFRERSNEGASMADELRGGNGIGPGVRGGD